MFKLNELSLRNDMYYCQFQGINFRLAFAIGAGAFGSAFQHGYNTGVLNAPQKLITEWIGGCNTTLMKEVDKDSTDMDTSECKHGNNEVVLIWSWIVAVFCVGGVIGGSTVGVVSSRLGRFVQTFIFLTYLKLSDF